MNPVEAHALALTVETRIGNLWRQEQADRRWRADWSPARHARMTELRALLALRRSARRLARQAVEREDPITSSKAYEELGYHPAQALGPA